MTFRYEDGRPIAIEAVVLSTQHDAEIDTEALRAAVSQQIIAAVIPASLRAANYRELINPTGRSSGMPGMWRPCSTALCKGGGKAIDEPDSAEGLLDL